MTKNLTDTLNKISIISLGCSKNLMDSEHMLGIIKQANLEVVENEEDADVIIINTCSFITSAKQESIDTVLEMAQYKKAGTCKALIVAGCMAQRYADEILSELPEVDAVVGVNDFDKIADIIKNVLHTNKTTHCGQEPLSCEGLPRLRTTPAYTAYLKIAEGCNNRCTYCIIPYIRGSYRSRKTESIIAEAKALAADGVKELIIIAQDTTAYGKDLYGKYRLSELLTELCEIDGIEWIRLHYCYPELITDDLINVIAKNDKICKYLDIPIQHCNNEILKRMNRRTSKEQIIGLIEKLRSHIPDIVLRTSLIVGFPGETDEHIEELKDFIEKTHFDKLGIFTYSQEEGTPAAKLPKQINEETKSLRQEILLLTQSNISEQINAAKMGSLQKVLVEGYDNIIKRYYGRTYADSIDIDGKVFFTSKQKLKEGQFIDVHITEAMEYDLIGKAL